MDDILRLPPVSRMHFIECSANTGMEWATWRCPRCSTATACCRAPEFTGVPLRLLLEDCGVDWKKARYVLPPGAPTARR